MGRKNQLSKIVFIWTLGFFIHLVFIISLLICIVSLHGCFFPQSCHFEIFHLRNGFLSFFYCLRWNVFILICLFLRIGFYLVLVLCFFIWVNDIIQIFVILWLVFLLNFRLFILFDFFGIVCETLIVQTSKLSFYVWRHFCVIIHLGVL